MTKQTELDEDQIELVEYLEECGWTDVEIATILEKYYNNFPNIDDGDSVSEYLDYIKIQEKWE